MAYATVAVLLGVGAEGAWRGVRDLAAGPMSGRLSGLLLVAFGVTSAGGLGILAGGGRPGEVLHFVYAALALGAVPVAASVARGAEARLQGFATLAGALVAMLVVARLFQTG
jgi:hypothetical protein